MLFAALAAVSTAQASVDFPWVTVGDPGNPPDPVTGFGGVNYIYEISACDVTNAQYAAFLNAVDPGGANTLRLWNNAMTAEPEGGIDFNRFGSAGSMYAVKAGFEKKPVAYEAFFSALRFANWLNNGQGNASTETGAYTLMGGTPIPFNSITVTRNPGAKVFLTSENEWYKAAYYQGNGTYTLYATGSATPAASAPTTAPNSANYNNAVGGYTDVGAYTGSPSHYGTFDQAGNIWNWNESIFPDGTRGLRGNAFVHDASMLRSTFRYNNEPGREGLHVGFRVARLRYKPVSSFYPLSLLAVAFVAAGTAVWLWKFRKPA